MPAEIAHMKRECQCFQFIRETQIFEGANDILYNQITEAIVKQMKAVKENNVFAFLKEHKLTELAAEKLKKLLNFNIDTQMSQR